MIKICSLWKKQDKNGKPYLTGGLNQDVQVFVYPIEYKTTPSSNAPSHVIRYAERKDQAWRKDEKYQKSSEDAPRQDEAAPDTAKKDWEDLPPF